MNRSRTKSRALGKRKTYSRSTSRSLAPKRLQFPMRSRVVAAPSVGLGMSATTVLRTSFFYNATAAASGIWTGYLKPGSAFDPSGDLAVMQPQMFDQWAAMYNRYKVNSAVVRIKVTGAAAGGTGSYTWVGAAYPSVDSTALATYQAAASQQYAKTTSGGFQYLVAGATGFGAGTEGKYLSIKLNHNAVVGCKTDPFDNGALVTSDPGSLYYMVLPIFLQANAAVAAQWVLEVDIWQNVTFLQKKNVVDA